ncbi:MAG TPA: hypothetical protein VFA77_03020 [Candidatus Eisenbacteria bacterium]|jgi:uncharacterized protein (TIGR03067 family)|nr:hypothetical protein [Candidatus Eisenbacteria bacterium]
MKMTLKESLGFTALSLLLPCLLLGLQAGCTTNPPTASALQRLQGTWEEVGSESDGNTITFTGNSLHFQGGNTNEWHEATFTLPAGTSPQQLRATITGFAPTNRFGAAHIGKVVAALFKIEDGTLTVAGEPLDGSKAFEGPTTFHYKLRKVQPQKKNAELPKSQ